LAQNRSYQARFTAACQTGKYKFDYRNGVVKVALSGEFGWKTDKVIPHRYKIAQGGYRLLGKRQKK